MGNWEWNNILIADFHDIHFKLNQYVAFQKQKTILYSVHVFWLETFWNVFSQVQLSES